MRFPALRKLAWVCALAVCCLLGARTAGAGSAGEGGGPGAAGARVPSDHPFARAFPLSFDSEWIRLHIQGDSLEVRGTYWLVCQSHTTSRVPLFYPFPVDSLLGGARMVSATVRVIEARPDAAPGAVRGVVDPVAAAPESVAFEALPGPSGVRWWMPPCPGDTLEIEAVYRQKILTRYARYIVTTTRKWERPLRRARFEIHLPAGATPNEFSFPFVKRENGGGVYYFYEAREFFPDRDIMVRWSGGS